jgi:hypothetical protein
MLFELIIIDRAVVIYAIILIIAPKPICLVGVTYTCNDAML